MINNPTRCGVVVSATASHHPGSKPRMGMDVCFRHAQRARLRLQKSQSAEYVPLQKPVMCHERLQSRSRSGRLIP